jgi:hypothetical protein
MFYKKEDVNDVITCEICSQTYKDPRLLPCGDSACYECIVDLIQKNKDKQFECVFCKEIHHSSEFYPNKTALKFVEKKAEEVYRFKCYEELKDKLSEMKRNCESFENNLDNGVSQIQEHCSKIKNEVYLRAEILIDKIHQITEGMITEIDEYEKKCLGSFNSKIDKYCKDSDNFLIEIKEFYNSTSNYMNEFKINEEVVEKLLVSVSDLTSKLNKEENYLKKIKFNKWIIQFIRSPFELKEKLIGSLGKEYFMFEEFSLSNLPSSNLPSFLLEHDNCGQKALFYLEDNSNLEIDLLDSKGKLVKHVTNVIKTSHFYAVKSSDNYICNTILDEYSISIFGNPITRQEHDKELLIMIDNEFNYLKHKVISYEVFNMACNDSTIICIDSDENFYFYDMDLELIVSKPFDVFRRKNEAEVRGIFNIKLNENY